MSALDTLIAARARIATPERWTQGANARDLRGASIDSDAPDAACWCAGGAILAEARREYPSEALMMLGKSIRPFCQSLVEFNDAFVRTHAEVLAAFDHAIAAERARGAR